MDFFCYFVATGQLDGDTVQTMEGARGEDT
jgi:hypothetical protein